MSKFKGFTAAGVLVLALSAGAAGGVMVLSQDSAPGPAAVDVAPAASEDEATATPPVTGGELVAESAVEEEPVAPTAPTPAETAREAAARAEKAATRSEDAAVRAEKAAEETTTTAPAPAPPIVPAPVPVPVPASPPCAAGEVRDLGNYNESKCEDGRWVPAAPERHCKTGGRDPQIYAHGETWERRSSIGSPDGDLVTTYRCNDNRIEVVSSVRER